MRQAQFQFSISTKGRGVYKINNPIENWMQSQGIRSGLITLFIPHTSASLLIQENADPDVLKDLNSFFNRLIPDGDPLYDHQAEGPDDMPAHLKSILTQTNLTLSIIDKSIILGVWQGVFLLEHRFGRKQREVLVHLIGD